MPPLRPCLIPGCTEYTTRSRCPQHQAQWEHNRRNDPTVTGRRGSTTHWKRLRARVLSRDQRTCTRCGTRGDLAVHHINGNPTDDQITNLTTLCFTCHRNAHTTNG